MFPPLLKSAASDVKLLVRKLQDDHRHMQSRWSLARTTLQLVATGSTESWIPLTPAQTATLQDFADLYASHIEAEERIAYPSAQTYLTSEELQAMQTDMMRRRGVKVEDHGQSP